ncbi:MAG TPA: glycine cleavage T C-terminal barrel domain-containing protein [Polyangiaceae bacterium]|nr:glycine cleavage T C-terminal barrel domain-containing protein [Polyangiaceae bacterium]
MLAIRAPDLATLVVTGSDRVSWLNGLVTCDLVKRADGAAPYGLVVSRNGRIVADATIVIDGRDGPVLVVVSAGRVETLRAHLEHYLVMEDAEISASAGRYEVWLLHGARSSAVLTAAQAAGAAGGVVDRTGLGGAVVLAPVERAAEVRAAVEEAVRVADGAIGDEAGWEALRLERGVPRYGADFDDQTYPQEASLEKSAVSFDKGCYLGQEVVCMLELRGHVKRKLVPVVIDAGVPPAAGEAVTDEQGAPAGQVTSAASSPTLGKAVALAMLKRPFAEPGKAVRVAGAAACVVDRPA